MKYRRTILLWLAFVMGAPGAVLPPSPLAAEDSPAGVVPGRTHRIRWGETLARIAWKYYGNGKWYPLLAEANAINDPHRIISGRIIVIPPRPAENAPPAAAPPEPAAPSLSLAPPPFLWRREPASIFNAGEKLTFAVRWQFITVGYATMEVQGVEEIAGRQAYHIVTDARSVPFFDTFYKVRNVNESWMDTESLCSLKFASRNREGKTNREETILLDQEKQQFQIIESGETGAIPPWVQDVLSSLYYLRTKQLAVGEGYSIDTHSGDKSWPLKVDVLRREKIKVPAGEFDCFVVEPSIREGAGIFQAKGKLLVWLTADDRKVPVMMRSSIAVGAIEALLTEMKLQ